MFAPSTLTVLLSGMSFTAASNQAGAAGDWPLNGASGPSLEAMSFAASFMRVRLFVSGRSLTERFENAGARHDRAVAAPDAALHREQIVVDTDDVARAFHPIAEFRGGQKIREQPHG